MPRRFAVCSFAAAWAVLVLGCPQFEGDFEIASEAGAPIDASTVATAMDGANIRDSAAADAPTTTSTEANATEDSSDTSSDDTNCGAPGYACVHGRHCSLGRCVPAWLPMSSDGAPTARWAPGAVLAGKFIVAGGSVDCHGSLADAAEYDPDADMWTALPDLNSARSQHTLTSSGTAVFAFGGLSDCLQGSTQIATLESWQPNGASWIVVNAAGGQAPAARFDHEAAWTGSTLLIYGGASGTQSYVASGAVFDPLRLEWSDASCSLGLAPCARNNGATIADPQYVSIWGGAMPGDSTFGVRYQITTGSWSVAPKPPNTPAALTNPADDGRRLYFPLGGGATNMSIVIYDRDTDTQTTDDAPSPANLYTDGAIGWIGSEVVLWGGDMTGTPGAVGGRYQPPAP